MNILPISHLDEDINGKDEFIRILSTDLDSIGLDYGDSRMATIADDFAYVPLIDKRMVVKLSQNEWEKAKSRKAYTHKPKPPLKSDLKGMIEGGYIEEPKSEPKPEPIKEPENNEVRLYYVFQYSNGVMTQISSMGYYDKGEAILFKKMASHSFQYRDRDIIILSCEAKDVPR